jgi:RNA polymerase sigma-70 factor (ECF subfamily)
MDAGVVFRLAEAETSLLAEVERARAGDEAALTALIERYQGRIARFVRSLVGPDDDAEDLCQSVFVKMVLAVAKLKNAETFQPWLFLIARNTCRDHLRRRKWRRMFVPWNSGHEQIAAPPVRSPAPSAANLDRAMAELPREQRELIALLRENDWSYEDLSRITGASLPAVKSRLFRARQNMRTLLGHGDSENES